MDNDLNNSHFVTFGLVAASIFLRLIGEVTSFPAVIIVGFINALMIGYLCYRIYKITTNNIHNTPPHDRRKKKQEDKCKKGIILFITILGIVYLIGWIIGGVINSFGAFFNDIVSIIIFGVSIEEEYIEQKLAYKYLHKL